MAEAVGLIASVATLAEVAFKLTKLIARLRDAPAELLALSNEVTDLRSLFTEIERLAIEQPDSQARLSNTLKLADDKLSDLHSLLQKVDKVDIKLVDRMVWLRHRPSVVKLQSELHDVRVKLNGLFQVDALSTARRIEAIVQSSQNILIDHAQKLNAIEHGHDQLQNSLACMMQSHASLQTGTSQTTYTSVTMHQQVTFVSGPSCGPSFGLTVRNIISPFSPWFECAMVGDLDGLKSLLESGSVRVNDTDHLTASTALFWAFIYKHVDVYNWLLQMGADARIESFYFSSTLDLQRLIRVENHCSKKSQHSIDDILSEDVFTIAEEWQLPELHRAILKLTPRSLSSLILEPATGINEVDLRGGTALWWAAYLGDVEDVQMLLEHGADPNIKDDIEGQTPLHSAASNLHNPKTWKLLVRHGADTTFLSKRNETIFHFASMGHGGARSLYEQRDFVKTCVALGTPLDARDPLGYTAVMNAVSSDIPLAVRGFLECGADYTIATEFGSSILHIAACKAGVETLNVLAAHGLPGLDVDCRDADGESALEVFEARKGEKTPQQIVAFYKMWGEVSLKARRNCVSDPGILVIEELDSEEGSSCEGASYLQEEECEEGREDGSRGEEDESEDEEDVFVDAPAF